jgi:AraC family carnitine catabolism transcriptional activator
MPDGRPGQDIAGVVRYGFLLLPEFPLYALIPALEALRIANQNRGRRLYRWDLISADGQPVTAGSGMRMGVDAGIRDVPFHPFLFVVGGNHPLAHAGKPVLNWLRRLGRHGATLGAIDTGAFALAAAGLLGGRRVTLHWEVIGTFREHFPDIATAEQLFVDDGDRVTCAGGHAALDLMLHLISRAHGPGLAGVVANAFVAQRMRGAAEPQRLDASMLAGDRGALLPRVLRDMEAHIAQPLAPAEIARRAGISVRSLGRIVRDRLGESPARYYRRLRLQAARNALFYSDAPVAEIARACGFGAPEVFSRAFRAQFGLCPRDFRRRFAAEKLSAFRPELSQPLEPPATG